jgi:hypothetical protein
VWKQASHCCVFDCGPSPVSGGGKVLTLLPFSIHARCMKGLKRKSAAIPNSRWLAYATAGAASAFACTQSAEGTVHYSGTIGKFFGSNQDKSVRFQLDQPGDSFRLRHDLTFCCTNSYGGNARFGVQGLAGAGFAGSYCPNTSHFVASVSKLKYGAFISRRPFLARNSGAIALQHFNDCVGQFETGDLGFIAFKFNNGSGDQYGWVRIKMGTKYPIDNDFWLVDYAYADPGEPIRAGQTSSNDSTQLESLGGLALGAIGLLAWRKSRVQAAR